MQDQATRRRGRIVLAILALILVPVALVTAAQPLFGRQTVEATVTLVDTPRTCRDSRIRLIFEPYRTSAPAQTGWLYCGLVITDHGAFALPQSGLFTAGSGQRESFVDALQAGCRYRLTVAGWGQTLAPGAAPATHGHKTLTALVPLGPCP
jgi:hypothetical protein